MCSGLLSLPQRTVPWYLLVSPLLLCLWSDTAFSERIPPKPLWNSCLSTTIASHLSTCHSPVHPPLPSPPATHCPPSLLPRYPLTTISAILNNCFPSFQFSSKILQLSKTLSTWVIIAGCLLSCRSRIEQWLLAICPSTSPVPTMGPKSTSDSRRHYVGWITKERFPSPSLTALIPSPEASSRLSETTPIDS